jgi:rhodanese-related sulfurtransferase
MAMDNITPQELKDKMDREEKIRLIDVREEDEWDTCHIEGAEWMPLSQFAQDALGCLDADEEIVLYCHHGGRSAKAQKFLEDQGYEKVMNLTGGIDAWSMEVDPSVPRY